MKITVVGGGSYAWMPSLLPNFISNDFFSDSEICLMDINEEALGDIVAYSGLLLKERPGFSMQITSDTCLERSLHGADFVIFVISHGGLQAELDDHVLARTHGHYNLKGSEVGIAGASRTIRHVREVVRISKLMEQHCPQAMLLNVTNPLTAVTRAVERYTSIQSAGFCHGIHNHLELLFPFFGCDTWQDVDFLVGGVDHCSWLLAVKYKGSDALQIMRDAGLIEKAISGENIATYDDPFAGRENQRLRFLLWNALGYLPGLSDEHCAEFFGQIMGSDETRAHYHITYDRIAERTKTVTAGRERLQNMLRGDEPVRLQRGGEVLDRFIQALHGGGSYVDVLNYRNIGQIPNLPMDSIVETKCLIDSTGVHPIMVGKLPSVIESIVRPIIIREEMYMEAAIEENIQKLSAALSTDPLVNDFRGIESISSALMEYNLKF